MDVLKLQENAILSWIMHGKGRSVREDYSNNILKRWKRKRSSPKSFALAEGWEQLYTQWTETSKELE